MAPREMTGIRAQCPLGGIAPCIDDMCHSGGQTLCGLDPDFDFCEHEFIPDTCPECWNEEHTDDPGDDE
jgi:hypothetical protein